MPCFSIRLGAGWKDEEVIQTSDQEQNTGAVLASVFCFSSGQHGNVLKPIVLIQAPFT